MRSASKSLHDEARFDDSTSLAFALHALAAAPPVPLEALAAPLAPGTCLDEFELIDVIGKGGMSVVYRARDKLLDRDVAVKVLNAAWAAADLEPDEMLEREARTTARLRHAGIVTIHRVGRHAGRLYLVLELLEGETLAARLTRAPLEQDEALAIGMQILTALSHAHAHGIVHRDIKPGNVLVEPNGTIKVLDFGLSGLALRSPPDGSRPWLDRVAGTPAYMAPELWRGEPADRRSDVYAAGLVLQELMAGSAPGRSRAGVWRGSPLQPLHRLCPVRTQVKEIVARAVSPDREDRFADAGEMAAALAVVVGMARRWRLTRRIGAVVLVASLVAAALGFVDRMSDRRPSVSDLSGSWQADPLGFGRATLTRIGPGLYAWEQRKRPTRVSDDTFYNRGTLELRHDGERIVLSGDLADEPGWCCGNVGFVELELTAPGELRVVKSLWGPRHGDYTTNHKPYVFRREATASR